MTLAGAGGLVNDRLGGRGGEPAARVTADSLWFHETAVHTARVMFEDMYWVKREDGADPGSGRQPRQIQDSRCLVLGRCYNGVVSTRGFLCPLSPSRQNAASA